LGCSRRDDVFTSRLRFALELLRERRVTRAGFLQPHIDRYFVPGFDLGHDRGRCCIGGDGARRAAVADRVTGDLRRRTAKHVAKTAAALLVRHRGVDEEIAFFLSRFGFDL
jgi:hypothetical protein